MTLTRCPQITASHALFVGGNALWHSTSSVPPRFLANERQCAVARWWNAKARSALQNCPCRENSNQFQKLEIDGHMRGYGKTGTWLAPTGDAYFLEFRSPLGCFFTIITPSHHTTTFRCYAVENLWALNRADSAHWAFSFHSIVWLSPRHRPRIRPG